MSRLRERAVELVDALDALRGQLLWIDDDGKGTVQRLRDAHEQVRTALDAVPDPSEASYALWQASDELHQCLRHSGRFSHCSVETCRRRRDGRA